MKKDQLKMENKSDSPFYDQLKMENKSNSPINNPFIPNTNRCQLIQKDEYLSPRAACCIRIKNQEKVNT